MSKVLSKEDKELLGSLSRYLKSMGVREATIEIDVESYGEFNYDDVDWDWALKSFSNTYNVEVPEFIKPTIQKIFKYVSDNNLVDEVNEDTINYERVELKIDAESKEIGVEHWWSYYSESEGSTDVWDKNDYEDDDENPIIEMFEIINDDPEIHPSKDGKLYLRYNGSGDSGYIEDYFEDGGGSVPSNIEDWCYRQLENVHGGWEINEGSQGSFMFDLKKEEVVLSHIYNTEETESNTLFEENF